MSLPDFVTARLESLGLAKADLLAHFGNSGTVSMVLAGKRSIPEAALDQWAEALRLDADGTAMLRRLNAAQRARNGRGAAYVEQIEQRVAELESALTRRDEVIDVLEGRLAEVRIAYNTLRQQIDAGKQAR